jgi:hypothetical protein
MPRVRNSHATVVHGRVHRVQAASTRPSRSAAMAKAKGTDRPT